MRCYYYAIYKILWNLFIQSPFCIIKQSIKVLEENFNRNCFTVLYNVFKKHMECFLHVLQNNLVKCMYISVKKKIPISNEWILHVIIEINCF